MPLLCIKVVMCILLGIFMKYDIDKIIIYKVRLIMNKEKFLQVIVSFCFLSLILFPLFLWSFFNYGMGNIIAASIGFWIVLYGLWRLFDFLEEDNWEFVVKRIKHILIITTGFLSALFIINCLLIYILSGDFIIRKSSDLNKKGLEITGYSGKDTNINIPEKILFYQIKTIRANTFENKSISGLSLPQSIEYIGDNAFSKNYISELILPQNIKYIGTGAFQYNNINKLKIPSSIEYIGHLAFNNNIISILEIGENVEFFNDTFGLKYAHGKASDMHYWEEFAEIKKDKEDIFDILPRDIIYDYKLVDPVNIYTKYLENDKKGGIYTINLIDLKEKPQGKIVNYDPYKNNQRIIIEAKDK